MVTESSQIAASVNTTQIWDVISEIQQTNVNSPEFKELLIRMYQFIGLMANVLNIKDTGVYNNAFETVNGQTWFPNPTNNSSTNTSAAVRQVYRKVFLTTATINHGITITPMTTFTRIYGVFNDTVGNNYYPVPWASAAGATNIELKVNATQIVITNNSGVVFNVGYVVLEFIQS